MNTDRRTLLRSWGLENLLFPGGKAECGKYPLFSISHYNESNNYQNPKLQWKNLKRKDVRNKMKKRGCIYLRDEIWWIKFYHPGRPIYESTKSDDWRVAERLLLKREKKAEQITQSQNHSNLERIHQKIED